MTTNQTPKAKTERLIVREIDGETLVYDRSRDAASCLNEFAAKVWRECDGETSVAGIAAALGEDEPAVWLALHQLTKAQLLTEAIAFPPDMSAAKSRRDIVIGRLFRLSRLAQTIACRRRFVRGRGLDQSGGLSLPCGFRASLWPLCEPPRAALTLRLARSIAACAFAASPSTSSCSLIAAANSSRGSAISLVNTGAFIRRTQCDQSRDSARPET